MAGIVCYGSYIPRYRLSRSAITTPMSIGVAAATRGSRSVASYDEDTTTMGIEAARRALAGPGVNPRHVYFGTANPAYLERTNATTIHAALALDHAGRAVDLVGSMRAASAAVEFALQEPAQSLVVVADIRTSLPGGQDERDGGDAAAALVMTGGSGPVVAEHLADAAVTEDFLDRWRLAEDRTARRWEERFGQELYQALGAQALTSALETCGLSPAQVDHLIVSCANGRAATQFARSSGVRREAILDDLLADIGNTGAAHFGVLLCAALDKAQPGEVIAMVVLADGAQAHVFRVGPLIDEVRKARRAAVNSASETREVSYTTFLRWREMLPVEPPRRPDPGEITAPGMLRAASWKLDYAGSRCLECDELHFPPQRVCQKCTSVDRMRPQSMAHRSGTVVTSLTDRITWSPSPPAAFAVVNLDGGGRVECEVTELDGQELRPGDRVELTFRKLSTTRNGIHNYFWKLRPVRAEGAR